MTRLTPVPPKAIRIPAAVGAAIAPAITPYASENQALNPALVEFAAKRP